MNLLAFYLCRLHASWLWLASLTVFAFACAPFGEDAEGRLGAGSLTVPTAGTIDLGDPASAPFLLSGWIAPEQSHEDRAFVAGQGEGSMLLLPTLGGSAMVLTLEGRPFPEQGEVQVSAFVSGNQIGSQSLPIRGGIIAFDIPAELTTNGSTQIDLQYSDAASENYSSGEKVVVWRKASYETVNDSSEHFQVGLWSQHRTAREDLLFDQGRSSGPFMQVGTNGSRFDTESGAQCDLSDAPSDPNILLYLIDTLRVDRVGAYGNERGLTPVLDALAEKSLVLERAVAQSPWTRPSVASLVTGLTPPVHGVVGRKSALAPEFLTLAEVLSAQGYATVGFVTNPNVSGKFGLRQGFDLYSSMRGGAGSAWAVNRAVEEWLAERESGKPFFLYLHTVEPHAPYLPSPEFAQRFASEVEDPGRYDRKFMRQLRTKKGQELETIRREMELLYDAEVAENDAGLGELLEILEDPNLENTVVVVVSDHGEEFLEHGRWEHGNSLHTEVLDLPFVIYLPGCSAQRIPQVTQHVDLLPTLLDYLKLPALPGLAGDSLLRPSGGPRVVLSHVGTESASGNSLTTEGLRYIRPEGNSMGGTTALYDRVKDPLETVNVFSQRSISALYFASKLALQASEKVAAPEVSDSDLDPEMVKRLRALGYID